MARGVTEGRDYWTTTITDYHRSGLSQTIFAKRNGISVWTLKAWIARLKQEGMGQSKQVSEPAKSGEASKSVSRRMDEILVGAAKKHGSVTTGQVAKALQVPAFRARMYLRWLVEEGRLAVEGEKRRTRYVPTT